MRLLNKTVVWLIAAVSILLFFFGFFGAKTHYGDVATIVINGAEQLNTGIGLSQTVTVKLSATAESALDDAQLEQSKRVVEQRLATFNVTDYAVYCDYDAKVLLVELPYSANLNSVLSLAGAKADFVVRKGTEETDSSIVFSLTNVESAEFSGSGNEMFSMYSISVKLDSAAKAALKEATQAMADEYAATEAQQVLSIWYDGQFIAKKEITQPIKNGVLTVDAVFGLDSNKVSEMSILMNSEDIPFEITPSAITEVDYSLSKSLSTLMIAAASAAAAYAIYLLLRYRLSGLTAIIALLGTAGSIMAIQTGFIGTSYNGFAMSSVAAFVIAMMLAADTLTRDCVAIKEGINGRSIKGSISQSLERNIGLTLRSYVALIIVSIILSLFTKDSMLFMLVAPLFDAVGINSVILSSVGYFGKTLISGSIMSLIFCVLGNRLMLSSICSYDLFKKSVLFGGASK